MPNEIIAAIVSELERRGLSPSDLARALHMHPKHIYRYLSGKRAPSIGLLCEMLRALDLHVTRKRK